MIMRRRRSHAISLCRVALRRCRRFATTFEPDRSITVALATRRPDLIAVVAGTARGMLIADVANRFGSRIPSRWVRTAAPAVLATLGAATLLGLTI